MKVYLAAPYASRQTVRDYADELTRIGFRVVSSWLNETHEIAAGTTAAAADLTDAEAATHAATDLRDIDKADLFVAFTEASVTDSIDAIIGSGSGGRHVETGYAIAVGKPVVLVGSPENIFHRYGAKVTVVPTWHDAVIEVSARLVSRRTSKVVAMSG